MSLGILPSKLSRTHRLNDGDRTDVPCRLSVGASDDLGGDITSIVCVWLR